MNQDKAKISLVDWLLLVVFSIALSIIVAQYLLHMGTGLENYFVKQP